MATLEDNTVCFLAICIVVSVPYWLLYNKKAWELLDIIQFEALDCPNTNNKQ